MAERFKAVVLKTIIANTITSSNLVLPFFSQPAAVSVQSAAVETIGSQPIFANPKSPVKE